MAWDPSSGEFSYPRSVTFVITPSGGYVAQAKRYREEARKKALYKPLRGKRAPRGTARGARRPGGHGGRPRSPGQADRLPARTDDAGSYQGTLSRTSSAGAAELTFTGTGVCWLGALDPLGGRADVYLDDKLAVSGLSLRHYRTQPRAVVFSREGLPDGPHAIRIVSASGGESSLSLDAFQILGGNTKGRVRLVVNNEWNYPKLGWGNYVKDPIFVVAGYENQVRLRLGDSDEPSA